MRLTVNGLEHELASGPLEPLLHALREELGITSPKAGCQEGGCGACTVLVDGEPRRSCLVPLAAVEGAPEPLATFARHVGDHEIRGQATIGGNLCAPPGGTTPVGDLQAPLLALDARIRSVGADGERTDSIDDFLEAGSDGRLVLELLVDEPSRAAAAAVGRPHTHAFTILGVAAAQTASGIRVAVAGAGPRAVRAPSVEQALAAGTSPAEAAQKALDDIDPQDDAVASAHYRRQVLPTVVTRALDNLS